jgi:hypothetical protein
MSIDSKTLRKVLRQIADLVADKAEQDSVFAEELVSLISLSDQPTKSKTKSVTRKDVESENDPDPFKLFLSQGVDGLQESLKTLDIEQLRKIIRKHRFDPSRTSSKWKEEDKERFIALISDRVKARCKQGDTFRQYGSQKT